MMSVIGLLNIAGACAKAGSAMLPKLAAEYELNLRRIQQRHRLLGQVWHCSGMAPEAE